MNSLRSRRNQRRDEGVLAGRNAVVILRDVGDLHAKTFNQAAESLDDLQEGDVVVDAEAKAGHPADERLEAVASVVGQVDLEGPMRTVLLLRILDGDTHTGGREAITVGNANQVDDEAVCLIGFTLIDEGRVIHGVSSTRKKCA